MATECKTFAGNYDKYSDEANPTRSPQMQEFVGNQNVVLKEVIDNGSLWQPNTAYTLNHKVYIKGGIFAICTQAGTSGTTEPTWSSLVGTVVTTDGTVRWFVGNEKYLNGSEKWYENTDTTTNTIDLNNGICQDCAGNNIVLPNPPSGGYATTLTLFITKTGVLNFSGGTVVWANGDEPTGTGDLIVTLYGKKGKWYGMSCGKGFA